VRFAVLIFLLALVTRLPALNDRFYSNDEATYSALAARLDAGGSMYVDAVDHKPPAIAALYAAVFAVAGRYDIVAVRLVLIVVVGLTGLVVGAVAVRLTGDPRARVAGVLYVLASATGFADNVQPANTELFLNLPIAGAALAVAIAVAGPDAASDVRPAPNPAWIAFRFALAAGALTGLAALFKYQAGLAGVAWALACVAGRARWPIKAVRLAGLALGFAAVGGTVLGLYWWRGHFDAWLFWGWRYNFSYIESMPLSRQAARGLGRTVMIAAMWSPLVLLASRRSNKPTLLVVWLIAMAVAVTMGGRYFGNYYLMLLPALAVAAALAPVPRQVLVATATLAAVSLVGTEFWFSLRPDLRGLDDTYRTIGGWVRAHSDASDRLFVWGDSAQIYVYSGRVMATRFAFANYHTGKIWGTGADEPSAPARTDLVVPRAWDELAADFRRAPPDLVVDAAAAGLHGFGGHALTRYPGLASLVRASYAPIGVVDGACIYRRVAPRQ
jgi:hypothetical protein